MNFYIIFISFCHYSFVILVIKVTLKLVNARINAKLKIKFTFFQLSIGNMYYSENQSS